MKIIFKILLILLFTGCFFTFPYEYYLSVRIFGTIGFIWLLYSEVDNLGWFAIWLFSAILLQPIFKIPLGRENWQIVDGIWIGLLVISIGKDYFKKDYHFNFDK